MPTILEMPEIEGGFVETIDPYGPYGAKGLAEPPVIAVAPAICNAIYDADRRPADSDSAHTGKNAEIDGN